MADPIVAFDLQRMFLGDHPALFYAEIIFRTALVYGYTLTLIRWIGGRSVAQLSMVDLLLVIALGSAVGDATFYPEVPLFHAMLVITLIVGLNKLLDTLIERSDVAKRLIDGRTITVVSDSRILCEALAQRDLSPLEIKSMLRMRGISNLGEIESAYLEASGGLSVFRRAQAIPGLAIVPPLEVETPAAPQPGAKAEICCTNCGARRAGRSARPDLPCPDCHRDQGWTATTCPPPGG
ncbi:DUF421 domain-containing protein [Paracoccus alkenifer]|uniref:Uncharacterized membrane protein YcaP, DUF421 family n=1 Tax=Paracoccus alkenifer TaxID=65735 RepID=A0A1H6MWW9_9RHOB|nr:YetF domain-containing protein [Paracoccus alkenifer]SEI03361.1 Uncharacterized membrane protein YcaP, DUF421 family [Paracoccus alkenifer]